MFLITIISERKQNGIITLKLHQTEPKVVEMLKWLVGTCVVRLLGDLLRLNGLDETWNLVMQCMHAKSSLRKLQDFKDSYENFWATAKLAMACSTYKVLRI